MSLGHTLTESFYYIYIYIYMQLGDEKIVNFVLL